MSQHDEKFLSRWSRLKKEQARKSEGEKQDPEPAPTLPSVDQLTAEADFAPFMHPKVQDALRRVALKKLFSDPRFNVPDPFEAYSGDWTGGEPIGEELLPQLNHARTLLFDEDQKKKEQPEQQVAQNEPQSPNRDDEPGRQDT